MINIRYIQSLHRPFNQNLNTIKWVCSFVKENNNISKSDFYVQFYIYLIKKLYKQYSRKPPKETTGLPSLSSVKDVYNFFKQYKDNDLVNIINTKVKKRTSSLDRTIYSTYKAASYYINLAKDKFEFIEKNYKLTSKGIELLNKKSRDFQLTKSDREIFFKAILDKDFHFFISNCYFEVVGKKYKISDLSSEKFDFLDKYYQIRHFNYTSASLVNYNTVRNFWIKDLDVIGGNNKIRKFYANILEESYFDLKNDIDYKFNDYIKSTLIEKRSYIKNKNKFILAFKNCKKNELGFANLYDLKQFLRMGAENYQKFLSDFYENERKNYNIFYNNIVTSIDKRKRFYIREKPVLSIKIKQNGN